MPAKRPPRKTFGATRDFRSARRYGGYLQSIVHIYAELARLDLRTNALKSYQQRILMDLDDGPDEGAMAKPHEWWRYDTNRLMARGSDHDRPAKPRIDVTMDFTSKGNFALTWQPTGAVNKQAGPSSDWRHWRFIPGIASWRPESELLFVRELEYAYRSFRNDKDRSSVKALPENLQTPDAEWHLAHRRREYRRYDRAVDASLLKATADLVDLIKKRLDHHFDVSMRRDIFMEWDEDKRKGADSFDYRLRSWEIEDTAERTARLEAEELKDFAKETGCSAEKLVKMLNELDVQKRPGLRPTSSSNEDRLTKALKKAGYKITPLVTRRYLELLKRRRPELFPRPPRGPPTVVPFKPRDGST